MTDRGLVGLGVEPRVIVPGREVVGTGEKAVLSLLKHSSRLRLVLAVAGHDLLKLFVRVVGILYDRGVGRDQEPLVHVDDVDVECRVLLLESLRVVGGFVPVGEGAADLDAELIVLLRRLGADDGEARVELAGDGGVILSEGHFFYTDRVRKL